jgi:hypothetical protein
MKYDKERRMRRKTQGQRIQEQRIKTDEYRMRVVPDKSKYKRESRRDYEEDYDYD